MSTNVQTIESQDLSLDKVFSDFYVVPNYQREYVWTEIQVEQLLQDIFEEFSENSSSEYFIGSLVVCLGSDGCLELIDGQQRMTTTYILLCAVRDYIEQLKTNVPQKLLGQLKSTTMTDEGQEVSRHRLNLLYDDSQGILSRLVDDPIDVNLIPQTTKSIANIVAAYKVIQAFLHRDIITDYQVRRFYAYVINRVKLVRIKTPSVAHALKVFETINDRGVGLDSMDLLKNLMFMQTSPKQFDKLKNVWKTLVDTLYEAKEKPLRFLRYFIFSTYDVDRLKEDQIYSWFVDNKKLCGYDSDPMGFVTKLSDAAKSYAHFLKGQNRDGSANRYLKNLTYLSGSARQHLILLLAGQHLTPAVFTELCRQIENLFFAYIVTREPTKDFERLFASWTNKIRSITDQATLNTFVLENI